MDLIEWERYYEWKNKNGVYGVKLHPGYCIVVYKLLQQELKLGHQPCLHYTRLICKHLAQMLIPTPDICDKVRYCIKFRADTNSFGDVYQHWTCHSPCLAVYKNNCKIFAKGYCVIPKK